MLVLLRHGGVRWSPVSNWQRGWATEGAGGATEGAPERTTKLQSSMYVVCFPYSGRFLALYLRKFRRTTPLSRNCRGNGVRSQGACSVRISRSRKEGAVALETQNEKLFTLQGAKIQQVVSQVPGLPRVWVYLWRCWTTKTTLHSLQMPNKTNNNNISSVINVELSFWMENTSFFQIHSARQLFF